MTLEERVTRDMPKEARQALAQNSKLRAQLLAVYREYPDGEGRRGEITTPPTPGSHRHYWR